MKILILFNKYCEESSKVLAKELKAKRINPFLTEERDFTDYDLVINYGCNRKIKAKNLINKLKSVAICKDKIRTFEMFNLSGIPTVDWTQDKRKAYQWGKTGYVVVRECVEGNKNEGFSIVDPEKEPLPDAPLYTNYFFHNKEFRIVILNGKLVSSYEKKIINEEWNLIPVSYKYLKQAENACIKAAIALDIDYVGFDVLVGHEHEFKVLEANSAPIITYESIEAFKSFIKTL